MMMKIVGIIVCLAVASYAYPQGKVGVDFKDTYGQPPVIDLYGSQKWLSKDENTQGSIFGSHTRELGGENRHQTKVGADASHLWKFNNDRGTLGVNAGHQRELFGPVDKHQTNAGVHGSYDVFRSDDGKTRGTLFGGADQQWNSHSPNTRGYEYGGKVEHTWG